MKQHNNGKVLQFTVPKDTKWVMPNLPLTFAVKNTVIRMKELGRKAHVIEYFVTNLFIIKFRSNYDGVESFSCKDYDLEFSNNSAVKLKIHFAEVLVADK